MGSASCQRAEIVFLVSSLLDWSCKHPHTTGTMTGPTMAPISSAPSSARYQPIALLEKGGDACAQGSCQHKVGAHWQFMDEPRDESCHEFDDDCPDTPTPFQLRGTKLTRGEPSRPGSCNSMYASCNSVYKNSHCAGLTETRFARDELAVATCARWPSELELEEWARRQGLRLQASPRQ